MKRLVTGTLMLTALASLFAIGCMDRQPKPVCPVPTEVSDNEALVSGFDGVDMLVVVDNSGSMYEEQAILATGFFTLVNSLAKPIATWPYAPVANMRVAVVTSDMGLQYGGGSTDASPTDIVGCGDLGDDGEFQHIPTDVTQVNIGSGSIPCDVDGDQCPAGFTCEAASLTCTAPSDPYQVNCPSLSAADWAEIEEGTPNDDLATEVACLSAQGTGGCGIEQQLQSAARGLARPGQGLDEFLVNSHLLAVLVVSDEEDCSVEDPGLFTTDEWTSGPTISSGDSSSGHLNTSCNLPTSNEDNYLYPAEDYFDIIVELKGGSAGAVIFAAIAGVPDGSDVCQGKGSEIGDCLDASEMQMSEAVYQYPAPSTAEYYHFVPACTREEGGEEVTAARPGRRYVKLAQRFAGNSYIYSICNADWSPAMESIAAVIAEAIGAQCYPKSLEWVQTDEGCDGCGEAKCAMLAIFEDEKDYPSCPEGLEEGGQETINDMYRTYCEVPKIATPKYCDAAEAFVDHTQPGWYYCENLNSEDFDEACDDNVDNDGDGAVDCDDSVCADCEICGGDGAGECTTKCTYAVELTNTAKDLTRGISITIQCLQQFNFEDENCQENTEMACNNGEDDDGNGVRDCEAGDGYAADPHCCPLVVEGDDCWPEDDYSDICDGVDVMDGNADVDTVCEAHARLLKCTLVTSAP